MSENIKGHIQWSRKLEDFFKDLGEKCMGLSWLHTRAEMVFSRRAMCYDLPSIVFSTLAGSLSLSSSRLFGKYDEYGSIFTACISLCVGVLNTINTYFGYSRRAETSKQCSIQYAKLYRFIRVELSLPREERIKPKDLIKICQDQYERLTEISNVIPQSCIKEYKKKFSRQTDISHPEVANGIDPIEVYGWNRVETPTLQKPPIEKSSIEIEVKDEE